MGILDRLLGRNKDKFESLDYIDDEGGKLKGFSAAQLSSLSQKVGRRFRNVVDFVEYLDDLDQTWIIVKNGKILDKYETFPDFDTVMDDFYQKYGGGQYVVKALNPKTMRVGSYKLEGEDKMTDSDDTKKEKKPKLTPEDEIFYDTIKSNPEFKEIYVNNVLKRKLGLKEEKEKLKTLDEIIAERVERNPLLLEKLVEGEIEKRVGAEKKKKELSPLEQAKQLSEYWLTMKELFGERQEGTDWGSVFKEFIKQDGIKELVGTIGAVMGEKSNPDVKELLLQQQNSPRLLMQNPETIKILQEPVDRGIGETGGVMFAGGDIISQKVKSNDTEMESQFIQYLPYISELIKTLEPVQAFNLLNTAKPEYCDMLYSMNLDALNAMIKVAHEQHPNFKGKLNALLSEDGQTWLKELLRVNREEIDRELNSQRNPDGVVIG